jgi:hypothetical protein
MAARLLPLLVGLVCLCLAVPAGAGYLDEQNERACQAHGGLWSVHHTTQIVQNIAACTTDCFRYQVTCRNGKQLFFTSRYQPTANATDIFFYEHDTLPKLVIFGIIAAFAGIAVFGSRENQDAITTVRRHGIFLAVFGFTIWKWGSVATTGAGPVDASVIPIVTFIVFPVYVIYHGKAFLRGFNYLFVRHPVASAISSAIRTGEAINAQSVAQTLAAGAADEGSKPAYHYENQAEKAHELAERLERDAEMAEAALERERARADLAEAEAQLALLKRNEAGNR